MHTSIRIFYLTSACLLMVGCAQQAPQWSQAALEQRTGSGVQVKTSEVGRAMSPSVEYIRVKMQRSIFLDPPEGDTATYVRVRDTTGRSWNLEPYVISELQKNGFNVVRNAKNAAYVLQVNALFADEVSAAQLAQLDETEYGQSLTGLFGSVLAGAAIGGVGTALVDGDGTAVAAGAGVGAVVGGASNYLRNRERETLLKAQQETKFFSFVADVEVRERIKGGAVQRSSVLEKETEVTAKTDADLADNRDGGGESIREESRQSWADETHWKTYRTRVVGKAKGKLVVFADVEQDFADRLAKSLSGLF